MDPLFPVMAVFAGSLVFSFLVGAWRERWKAAAEASMGTSPTLHAARPFSLVVPARNAAATLGPLLQDLHAQTVYKDRSEVIVVDDMSDDATAGIVHGMSKSWAQLSITHSKGIGKKSAITAGINASNGDVIILTDADVRCSPERVGLIIQRLEADKLDLLLLPVNMTSSRGWLAKVQETELAGLVGMAAGEALMGRPGLANGANMAFTRSAFEQVEGYIGDPYASGDDVFLVKRMRQAGMRIGYLVDPRAVVSVEAESTWTGFVQQRLRWAGKMGAVRGTLPWIGLLALLLPWMLLYVTFTVDITSFNGGHRLETSLLLLLAWLLWLYPVPALVGQVRATFGNERSHMTTLIAFFAFSIYAPVIGILAVFVRPKWKGRVILR